MAEELNFEKSLTRLQEIVKLLEDGKTSLDETVELFKEGSALVDYCNNKLNDAEQKITVPED